MLFYGRLRPAQEIDGRWVFALLVMAGTGVNGLNSENMNCTSHSFQVGVVEQEQRQCM